MSLMLLAKRWRRLSPNGGGCGCVWLLVDVELAPLAAVVVVVVVVVVDDDDDDIVVVVA